MVSSCRAWYSLVATSKATGSGIPSTWRCRYVCGTFFSPNMPKTLLAFVENALISFFQLQMCGIAIVAKYIGNAQKVWIEGIQTRVDVTASMLSSMKVQKSCLKPAPG
jgi:hypothetical protein